jgi:DNA transposition AAA+ family ATPase
VTKPGKTAVRTEVWNALDSAQTPGKMIVLVGGARMGKTRAVKDWVNIYPSGCKFPTSTMEHAADKRSHTTDGPFI